MGREIREGERGHKRGKKKSSAFRFIRRLFLGSVLFLFVLSVLGYVIFIRPEVNRLRGIAYDKLAGSNLKDLTKRADTVVFDTDGQQLGTINAGILCTIKSKTFPRICKMPTSPRRIEILKLNTEWIIRPHFVRFFSWSKIGEESPRAVLPLPNRW